MVSVVLALAILSAGCWVILADINNDFAVGVSSAALDQPSSISRSHTWHTGSARPAHLPLITNQVLQVQGEELAGWAGAWVCVGAVWVGSILEAGLPIHQEDVAFR